MEITDKKLMSKKIYPWVKPLGLSSQNFSQMPEGSNSLVWGLKHQVIDEEEYFVWASEYYQLPRIQSNFFSLAFDVTLIEKFSDLYDWNAYCYPIYQWQDTLFVACLEPPQTSIDVKTCFVIAPFHPLESAWQKFENSKAGINDTTEQSPVSNETPNASAVEPSQQTSAAGQEVLGDLDFSGIQAKDPDPTLEQKVEEKADAQPPAPQESENEASAQEITSTRFDVDLNHLTSATQTMHASSSHQTQAMEPETETPEMPFDNLTIGGISLEGEAPVVKKQDQSQEKTRISANGGQQQNFQDESSLPSLDDLKAHQSKTSSEANNQSPQNLSLENDTENAIDDDYTPVPIISKAQQEAKARRKQEAQSHKEQDDSEDGLERTITDHDQPVSMPPENVISEEELKAAQQLENCVDLKMVFAHLFGHLKRDYQKLMWIEKRSESFFFPQFVYGDWKMTSLAWKMHVNLSNPNIFRVAFKSELPYHGQLHSNPFNDKYFEWWTRGKSSDFATIYPLIIDEEIIGFISCFGRNSEFDEVGSLKKIENLIAICKKTIKNIQSRKAA